MLSVNFIEKRSGGSWQPTAWNLPVCSCHLGSGQLRAWRLQAGSGSLQWEAGGWEAASLPAWQRAAGSRQPGRQWAASSLAAGTAAGSCLPASCQQSAASLEAGSELIASNPLKRVNPAKTPDAYPFSCTQSTAGGWLNVVGRFHHAAGSDFSVDRRCGPYSRKYGTHRGLYSLSRRHRVRSVESSQPK